MKALRQATATTAERKASGPSAAALPLLRRRLQPLGLRRRALQLSQVRGGAAHGGGQQRGHALRRRHLQLGPCAPGRQGGGQERQAGWGQACMGKRAARGWLRGGAARAPAVTTCAAAALPTSRVQQAGVGHGHRLRAWGRQQVSPRHSAPHSGRQAAKRAGAHAARATVAAAAEAAACGTRAEPCSDGRAGAAGGCPAMAGLHGVAWALKLTGACGNDASVLIRPGVRQGGPQRNGFGVAHDAAVLDARRAESTAGRRQSSGRRRQTGCCNRRVCRCFSKGCACCAHGRVAAGAEEFRLRALGYGLPVWLRGCKGEWGRG